MRTVFLEVHRHAEDCWLFKPSSGSKVNTPSRFLISRAVFVGVVTYGPFADYFQYVHWLGAPGEEIKPLNFEECGAFLEASHGERFEALYVLAIHCGLREGELLVGHLSCGWSLRGFVACTRLPIKRRNLFSTNGDV